MKISGKNQQSRSIAELKFNIIRGRGVKRK